MSTSSEYDFAGHDERVREHYDHAREKHPHFCDRLLPDWSIGKIKSRIAVNLECARTRIKAGVRDHNLMWNELADCEVWEATEAMANSDKSHAVEELYDCIAVCLRVIDVLEGRQILGRPETISGNSAGIKEKGTNDNEKDNIQDDLHLRQVQEGAGDPLRREGQRRKRAYHKFEFHLCNGCLGEMASVLSMNLAISGDGAGK